MSGRIAQIGSFNELQSQDGYVKSLAIEAHSQHAGDDAAEATTHISTEPPPVTATEEDEPNLARQNGDRSLYKFYLRSTGVPLSLGFLLLATGYIAMGRMPTIWYVQFVLASLLLIYWPGSRTVPN